MADVPIIKPKNIDGGNSSSVYGTSTFTAGTASTPNSSFPGARVIDGGDSSG